MADAQIENDEIESLKSYELDDDSSSDRMLDSSNIHAKLLHHLVDVSKVVQKRGSDPETEELLKSNNELVNELLSTALKPMSFETSNVLENAQAALQEVLVRKLADAEVDLADEKVKQYVNGQVDALVRSASALKRHDGKVTFMVDPKRYGQASMVKTVFLRYLSFTVTLYPPVGIMPIDLYVDCKEIPKDMSCKVRIKVMIRNQAGKLDWVRRFTNVYSQKTRLEFGVTGLIKREEYEDESLGLLKDGKLHFEISLEADKLVEIEEKPM